MGLFRRAYGTTVRMTPTNVRLLLCMSLSLNFYFIHQLYTNQKLELVETVVETKLERSHDKPSIDANEIVLPTILRTLVKTKLYKRTFPIDHGTYDPDIHLRKMYGIMREPSPCKGNIDLMFAIKSVPKNGARRDSLRNSWLDPALYDGLTVKHVFLFGYKDSDTMDKELERYNDALIGDFVDSFHNLTFKESMLLTWSKECCPARFIMKGDDDVFINPFEVTKLVKTMDEKKPLIHGSVMGNNPVIRDQKNKYADFKWNKDRYPPYVSGGGFIMNYKAAMAIQRQIPNTPLIAIDDAYIGICMAKSGLSDQIKPLAGFESWGFRDNQHDKWNVCRINKVIYYHKFLPDQMTCLWPKFLKYRDNCTNPNFEYFDEPPLCDPSMWYRVKMTDPILTGKNYHRCGPNFGHAACSVIEKDWTVQNPHNGPCCSGGHYCGTTDDHCMCGDCVDFRTITKVPGWMFKMGQYLPGVVREDLTAYKDLTEAMKGCQKQSTCGGVTHDVRRAVYELRSGTQFVRSETGERSWKKEV